MGGRGENQAIRTDALSVRGRFAVRQAGLELLDMPLHLTVVDLEREGPKIPAESPTAAIGVDGALRKDLLPDTDQRSPHDYRLTHPSRITASAPDGVVRLS